MGSKGSSQPQYLPTVQTQNQSGTTSSQATTTQSPDPLARLAYEQTLRNANQIAQTPFEPYQGQMIAGFTPDQLAAFEGVRRMQGVQTPYISQSGNLYQQSTNTWRNPMLPIAQREYNRSFTYIPNQNMGQVGSYTTGALTAATNPQMQTAQNYYRQGIDAAQNAQLGNALQMFGQAMGATANPELASARQFFGASFDAASNPLLSAAQDYAQRAALASQSPTAGITQDYLNRSIDYIPNRQLPEVQNLTRESVGLSDQERFNQQALARYMNPFQQSVVDATLAQMKQNQDVLQNQNVASAIRQGAFGGSGQFMGQAELGRQQALANAQTLAQLNAQNYAQAQAQYNQQQQQAIQARQQAGQLLGQLGQQQAGLGVQALQQAAQTSGQLGQQQAALSAQTLANLAQTLGQLGQSQAGLNVNALQQAAQTLGQLGQSQAGLQAGTATQIGQSAGQLGQAEAGLRSTAMQQAAQGLGQLGQQQSALLSGTGMDAARLYGQLGDALANRGVQAYQTAAQNLGQLGQAQQALGVNALQNAAQGVAGLGSQAQRAVLTDLQALMTTGEQQRALQQQQLQNAYNQWLQSRAYPYQQTSYFAGLAGGLGPLLGSTAQQQASGTSTSTGTGTGLSPYQQQQSGGGQIPGLISTGLGLLGSLFGLKDGGRVTGRKAYAEGGEAEEDFGDAMVSSPYSGGEMESPVTSKVGLGELMYQTPYAAPDDYISKAAKLQKAVTPAGARARANLEAKFSKALDVAPELRNINLDIEGSMPKWPKYTGASESGSGWEGVAKSVEKLAGSEKFRSGVSESLGDIGSLFKNFQAGGRVGYENGGTPQEQRVEQNTTFMPSASATTPNNTPLEMKIQRGWQALAPNPGANSYDTLLQQAMQRDPGPQLTPEQQGMPAMPGPEYYSGRGVANRPFSAGGDLGIAQSMGLPERAAVTPAANPYASADAAREAANNAIRGEQAALAYAYAAMGVNPAMATVMAVQQTQDKVAQAHREWEAARAAIDERLANEPQVERNQAERLGLPANYQNFVGSLYKNYLGRDPSESELNTHLQNIVNGAKPADVEASIRTSPEGSQTQNIQKYYEEYLGRPADLGSLSYWKQQLAEGVPLSQVANLISSSPEAQASLVSPVQGYYSQIADTRVNPRTGLFNLRYTAPYRGSTVRNFLPRKDGGRVGKAAGGGLTGKSLYNYLINIGATDKEAAMLTGMAKTESGFNPYVMHDRGTGYGLWGHGKDRWSDMQKYTGERKPGWEDQAKFALWELRNSPKVALARQALNRADDARDVAIAGMHFERPQGYKASAPWLGKNWQDRYSNVSNLMLGRDIGKGPTLRLAGGEPNEDSIMYKGIATPANSERPRGLIPRLIRALAPVSSAEAAPGSVLPRINPKDPSGPLLPGPGGAAAAEAVEAQPSPATGRKPMFAAPQFAMPELRNPRMATLPEALGRPNWPNEERGTLPEFKPEVREGFGPLRGEKPADPSQLLMEPTRHPNMGPEMPAAPTTVAEDRQKKESGQKYWGDWRDTEPFKSDPIGGFFDELMGEKPMADKPGTVDSAYYRPSKEEKDFDFGDLFRFANGGTARLGYAAGGGSEEEEDFDPLAELGSALESGLGGLGDALGGLFGEGRDARSAEEAAVVASDRIPRREGPGPISQGLLAAGLGMLAAPTANPWQALGVGGLRGLQVYSAAEEEQRKREESAAKQAAAEKAAERYQRQIFGGAPVSEDTGEEALKTPGLVPMEKPEEAAPAPTPEAGAPAPATPEAGVLEPETADIEADPTLRRLSQQYARVASIPAPPGMSEAKKAHLSNLKFQIEERRRQLESSVKARKAQEEAKQKTPEAKARAKMLETEQEALAKEAVGVEQAARQADQRIATLGRMKEAVESGRFSTGFGAETKLGLQKAVQSIFPKMVDEEAIAMAEQFEKDALQAVTDATGGKLGAGVSNADVEFLSRQQAGLGTSKAGNVLTLDAAIKIEQRKKDIAQFARDYREAHGGVLDQGYYKALSDWSEANPMFPTEQKKSTAPAETPQYTPEERAKAAEILRRRREGKQ